MEETITPDQESKILGQAADTLTDKPIKIEIDIIHPSWIDRIKKQKKRVFYVSGLTLGTLIKISKELLKIDIKIDQANVLETNYEMIDKHCEGMARIVALAIVNSKQDPPGKLVRFLLHNLTARELSSLTAIVLTQMDVLSFIRSIISLKGMNILKAGTVNAQTAKGSEVSL